MTCQELLLPVNMPYHVKINSELKRCWRILLASFLFRVDSGMFRHVYRATLYPKVKPLYQRLIMSLCSRGAYIMCMPDFLILSFFPPNFVWCVTQLLLIGKVVERA